MAHEQLIKLNANQPSLQLGALGGRLMGVGAALAVVGGGVTAWLATGPAADAELFYHAYLTVFAYFLSITLGALFFVILHHLARAGWSVTVRRIAEAIVPNVALMAILAVPLLIPLGGHNPLHVLYHWSHAGVTDPGSPHYDAIIAGKSAWLNPGAFYVRMAIYFAIWLILAFTFRGLSVRQDGTGDVALSQRMAAFSPLSMILLGATLSLAFVDLVMSLNPHWFSTIFGVYIFAGSVLGALVLVTLISLWLQQAGRIPQEVTKEHYHDLGKLTFAFTFFWGYIAFSQYMLIWYANLPEETQFFLPRQMGGWAVVSIILLICNLLIPFAGLLSRRSKRQLGIFTFFAVWLLLTHLLDMFWLVMPHLWANQVPGLVAAREHEHPLLPEALQRIVDSNQHIYTLNARYSDFIDTINYPLQPASLGLMVGIFLGMLGLYLISTAVWLRSAALAPTQDPRLPEALSFENV